VTRSRYLPVDIIQKRKNDEGARIDAVMGMFAHLPGSVEDFIKEKQKDIEIENRRWIVRINYDEANRKKTQKLSSHTKNS